MKRPKGKDENKEMRMPADEFDRMMRRALAAPQPKKRAARKPKAKRSSQTTGK